MKTTIVSTALAVLASTAAPAWAGCVQENRGNPHADGDKTRLVWRTRSSTTFQDWIWRGKDHPPILFCDWSNNTDCPFHWTRGYSQSWSKSTSVGFGAGASTNDWLKTAQGSLQFAFNRTWQKTYSQSDSFTLDGSGHRGQYGEPIVVQKRRWTRGNFVGGWYETSHQPKRYVPNNRITVTIPETWCYDYDANRTYGQWTTNEADGPSYMAWHIYY